MSTPAPPTPAGPPKTWQPLSINERRVLGVMVEKAKTTPENYPMSINALVTGSNQKSNRDPLLNLSEDDVEEALRSLQQRLLVLKITGTGRVDKWRHNLYDGWEVDKVELAILAELLLRGAQTEGELRGRASRMEEIPDLETLRTVLKPLVERKLVVYLMPEGKRGTMLTHGFCAPRELEDLKRQHQGGGEEPRSAPAPPVAAPVESGKLKELEVALAAALQELAMLRTQTQQEMATLKAQLSETQAALTAVRTEVKELRTALGG